MPSKVKLPRQWKFGSIPEEILMSNLSIYAKVTIGAITFHSFDDGPSYPGVNRLATLGSMNRKSVMKAIEELEAAGFLRVERVDGKSNSYEFLSKTSPSQGLVSQELVPQKVLTSPSNASKVPQPVLPRDSNETKLNETQKERILTPQQAFVEWFGKEYSNRFGKPYAPSKADFIMAGNNLKAFFASDMDRQTLKKLVFAGWNDTKESKDGFSVAGACMTVKGFCSMVNRITLAKPRAKTAYELEMEAGR